jgi:SAM-dependent methyltransferase
MTMRPIDIIDPFYLRRDVRDDLVRLARRYLNTDMVVFDIGCGSKPLAPDLAGRVKAHIGVDLDDGFYTTEAVDRIGSAYDVPATDGEADALISSQVLEHLERPMEALRESHRILKPGGIMLLAFPFLYPLHATPRDFFRYSEFGIRDMLHRTGFEIVELHRIGGFWYCMALYLRLYLQEFERGFIKKIRLMRIVTTVLSWPLALMHGLEGWMLARLGKDKSAIRSAWTINYTVVARKTEAV